MQQTQFDLHLHSYLSDGKESPDTVLRRAKKAGLSLVSLTDHNTVTDVSSEAALARNLKLGFLSGVELSCELRGLHIHLLGYGFNPSDKRLRAALARIQRKRRAGILSMIGKLQRAGFAIAPRQLAALPTEYPGLVHVLHLLNQRAANRRKILHEARTDDLFPVINYYFSPNGIAYMPEPYFEAEAAIKLIHAAGGIAALAHPGSHLSYKQDNIIAALARHGLDGLEVFTPKHNWDDVIHYEMLARKLKLAVTAGSNYHEDFHRQDISTITPIGFLKAPAAIYQEFITYLQKRKVRFPPLAVL